MKHKLPDLIPTLFMAMLIYTVSHKLSHHLTTDFQVRIMHKWNLLRILILVLVIIGIQGKRCGFNRKCFCYENSRLITCFRKNLKHVPQFTDNIQSQYDYLDLRWNNIRSVNLSDSFLGKLYQVDLRDNPIDCTIPRVANIKTDCFFPTTKNRNESGTTMRKSFSNNFSSISSTQPIPTDIISSTSPVPTVSQKTTTRSISSVPTASHKSFTRIISYRPSSKISARKSTLSSSSVKTRIPSTATTSETQLLSIKSVSTTMSIPIATSYHAEVEEPVTATVDFYLHVTLGPIAVIYVISSLIIILKQWMRRRHLRRMTM